MKQLLIVIIAISIIPAADRWESYLVDSLDYDNAPFSQEVVAYDSTRDAIITGHKIIYLSNDSIEEYSDRSSSPDYLSVDPTGHIWQSGVFYGAYEYDGTQWLNHSDWNNTNSGIDQLQRSSHGDIWFTIGFGTGTYTFTGTTDSLVNSYDPSVIREDNSGNIWLAGTGHNANSGEIYKWDSSSWSSFSIPSLIAGEYLISDLALQSDGTLWISSSSLDYAGRDTLGGVLRRSPEGDWTLFNRADGLPSCASMAVEIDHNNDVWIGTTLGLARFNGTTFDSWYPSDWGLDTTGVYQGGTVQDIAIDKQNRIWIATRGIYALTPDFSIEIQSSSTTNSSTKSLNIQTSSMGITIELSNIKTSPAMIKLYSIDGRLINEIETSFLNGIAKIERSSDIASGIYLLTVNVQNRKLSQLITY